MHMRKKDRVELPLWHANLRQPHVGSAARVKLYFHSVAVVSIIAVQHQRSGASQPIVGWRPSHRASQCNDKAGSRMRARYGGPQPSHADEKRKQHPHSQPSVRIHIPMQAILTHVTRSECQWPNRLIRDRSFAASALTRFTPQATELLSCREMTRWVRPDKTRIEHNTCAVALIAQMGAEMDFRRSGPWPTLQKAFRPGKSENCWDLLGSLPNHLSVPPGLQCTGSQRELISCDRNSAFLIGSVPVRERTGLNVNGDAAVRFA